MSESRKLRDFIKSTVRECLKEQKILSEKTLYHGTIIQNIPSIEQNGLMPTIGDFVKNMYAGSVDGDIMDYLEEILYATDKKQISKARNAIVFQIASKLNKDYHSVTNEDFRNYGALAVVKDGEQYFDFHSGDDYYGNIPMGVEPGDYYTKDEIIPDYILTGKKLVSFFRKFGLYPIKKSINESKKNNLGGKNLKVFEILSFPREVLIAKVLYDNGIKTQMEFREWVKTANIKIPQPLVVAVENTFRDFDIEFVNPSDVPNIFNLRD